MPIELGGGRNGLHSPWTKPTFVNSWVAYETGFKTPGYMRTADNRIELRGLIKHTGSLTAATVTNIFTLPEGYRPLFEPELFWTKAASGVTIIDARINVNTNGEVTYQAITTGVVDYLSLSDLPPFYAD